MSQSGKVSRGCSRGKTQTTGDCSKCPCPSGERCSGEVPTLRKKLRGYHFCHSLSQKASSGRGCFEPSIPTAFCFTFAKLTHSDDSRGQPLHPSRPWDKIPTFIPPAFLSPTLLGAPTEEILMLLHSAYHNPATCCLSMGPKLSCCLKLPCSAYPPDPAIEISWPSCTHRL